MSKSPNPIIRMTDSTFGDWSSITEAGVIEADAKSRGHMMIDRKSDGPVRTFSGVWEATAHVEKITDFHMDEIMVFLSGSCTITDETGHAEHFKAGDTALMPKGFNGEWRQDETLRKFYMIVDYGQAGHP